MLRPPSARTICSEKASPASRMRRRRGFVHSFATWRRQLELPDEKAENEEKHDRPDRSENKEPERVGRFREKHDVINPPIREGEPVVDAERDADEIGDSGH